MKRFSGAIVPMLLCALALVACGDAATSTPGAVSTTAAVTTAASTTAAATTVAASTTAVATTASSTTAAATTASSTTVVATTARPTGGTTTAGTTTSAATTVSGTPGASSTTTVAGGTTTAGAASNLGLPIYSGLKPLSLGSIFEQAITQGLVGQAGGSDVKYGVFSTSESNDKITAYYDDAMKQAGFTKAGSQPIPNSGQSGLNLGGKIDAYQKGTGTSATGAAVLVLGPLDATSIALFSSQSPAAAQQLKAGDSMVILFNNLTASQLTQTTPGAGGTQTTPATGTTSGALPSPTK